MRTISEAEYGFLHLVQLRTGKDLHLLGLSRQSLVEPMDDGGMGSLVFVSGSTSGVRAWGAAVVQGEFDDMDGVPVSFSINLDKEGRLFELDLWRVDFEPLKQFPSSESQIRIQST